MKNGTVLTLIICGTCCVIAPWAYETYHSYLVASVLRQRAFASVSLSNPTEALRWWSVIIGLLMILSGAIGSLARSKPQG